MNSYINLPPPGTIFSIESLKKPTTPNNQQPAPGYIIKVTKLLPEKTPVFMWHESIEDVKKVLDDFREDESRSILECFFNFQHEGVLQFSENNFFSFQKFSDFLKKNLYINRTKWLRSIDFLVKKEFFKIYIKLLDQKDHTRFTSSKYSTQKKNYLKNKIVLELNTRPELDLEQEKEALKELTRINRPFLAAGLTNYRNSKHILCISRRKKKNRQAYIEDKSQEIELQLTLSQSIWAKNLQQFAFQTLKFMFLYNKRRKELIKISSKHSHNSLMFYVLAAWTGYTAKKVLNLSKALKIINAWKYYSTKPMRMGAFYENIQEYLGRRKLARLMVSWKWFSSRKKLKDCMNILAKKYYRERLKARKLYELKMEVLIIIGSRKRYQELAKGDQNDFNKDNTVIEIRFGLGACLRKISQSLSKYRQEVFILSQNTQSAERIIYNSLFYPKECSSWKQWLLKKYNKSPDPRK